MPASIVTVPQSSTPQECKMCSSLSSRVMLSLNVEYWHPKASPKVFLYTSKGLCGLVSVARSTIILWDEIADTELCSEITRDEGL